MFCIHVLVSLKSIENSRMFNLEVFLPQEYSMNCSVSGIAGFSLSVLTTVMCMCGLLSLSYSLWRECVGWGGGLTEA